MALAPITIDAKRESVIDFTKPFWDFSMSLIMQKESEEELDLFAFVKPFDGIVWLLIIGVVSQELTNKQINKYTEKQTDRRIMTNKQTVN